jgi:hypothetical protein
MNEAPLLFTNEAPVSRNLQEQLSDDPPESIPLTADKFTEQSPQNIPPKRS